MDSLWQNQSVFIGRTQSTAIAKTNTIQLALVIDIQTMIPTDAHTSDSYILFGKDVQVMGILFALFIL